MFAWAPVPEKFKEAGSLLFSKLLIEEAGVAVAPGVGFGEYGEGYRAHGRWSRTSTASARRPAT